MRNAIHVIERRQWVLNHENTSRPTQRMRDQSGIPRRNPLRNSRRGGLQGPISNIERGEVTPTVKRLADILTALGYELHIEARKGRERTILDAASLMGKLPRAKDAPVEAPASPSQGPEPSPLPLPITPPEPPSEPIPEPNPDTLQDTLLRALART